ncbi:MAG: diguanylate cyclase [Firmicutes bacterium]|nr:diguanylate cyclase [Bacillota bacterium]
MIKRVRDILVTDFHTVYALDSVQKTIDHAVETSQEYFAVFDEGVFLGIVTYKDLVKAHPNRIVVDALSFEYPSVSVSDSIWKVKEMFEVYDTVVLPVKDQEQFVGLVDKLSLFTAISTCLDPLTGLYNGSYLYAQAEDLIEKGQEISILFADVNGFGQIDKHYGHVKGDMVLKELAHTLKESVGSDMFLCRYGGDEFAILTTRNAERCQTFAQELQRKVSSMKYCGNISLTIAVGIAGGRRRKAQLVNSIAVIRRLINLASLASTKAKSSTDCLHVADYVYMEEIA